MCWVTPHQSANNSGGWLTYSGATGTAQQHDFPILVVSLHDAKHRRSRIKNMLDGLGLSFSFWDAIDGRKGLSPEYERIIDRNLTYSVYGKMNDAEYACSLSHASIYDYIVKNNLPGAVVLEDDAIVDKRFKLFVEKKTLL